MRILGVDPGTRIAGYGLVETDARGAATAVAWGVLRLGTARPLPERLVCLFDGLNELIAAHRPDVVALEKAFYGKNIQSAMRIGEARAVVMLCAQRAGLAIAEYAPAMVKRAAVGAGRAHKSQVQRMVRITLGMREDPAPEDAADALAIALCHSHRAGLAARMT